MLVIYLMCKISFYSSGVHRNSTAATGRFDQVTADSLFGVDRNEVSAQCCQRLLFIHQMWKNTTKKRKINQRGNLLSIISSATDTVYVHEELMFGWHIRLCFTQLVIHSLNFVWGCFYIYFCWSEKYSCRFVILRCTAIVYGLYVKWCIEKGDKQKLLLKI